MATRVIIGMLVLAFVLSVLVGVTFWYLKRRAELSHERHMAEEERRHAEVDHLFGDGDDIDRELEREREREDDRGP